MNSGEIALGIKAEISVQTGEVWATSSEVILRSDAIGSCVGVVAFDRRSGVGALAHIMLPGCSLDRGLACNTKYARDAINDMFFKMGRLGAVTGRVEVCLVGGGNVLQDKDDKICGQLIRSVSEILQEKGIRIVARMLGGFLRRCVFIDIQEGTVYCAEGEDKGKLLYKWSDNWGGLGG